VVAGNPAPTLQWIKNGTAIAGATADTYQTPVTTTADQNAIFILAAVNKKGTASSTGVPLTVQWAPAVTAQPAPQSVTAGQTATFTVGIDGYPVPTVQWQKGGQNIAGATSATYVTPALTVADSGNTYLAVLTNSVGGATSIPAALTVSPAPVAVGITAQPQSQQALTGQSVSFTVAASGTAPILYQWRLNGTAIPGATDFTYTIPSVAHSDAGSYTVVVDNAANQPITSAAAVLTVQDSPVAPTILAQTQDLTLVEGNQASFQVVANGTAPFAYQWQRNQADIAGATGTTFQIPVVGLADSGAQFRCHVTNAVGGVYSAPSTLTVLPSPNPPVIVGFSASPDPVILGQSITLAWGVTAARSLSIDNGVGDVTGLSSKVVTPAQLGLVTYGLTAVNAAGTSTSSTSVTVNSGPSFPLSVNLGTGISGQPTAGAHTYVQGSVVNYAYVLAPGYQNLNVTVDGSPVTPTGTLVMNQGHAIQATALVRTLIITPTTTAGGTITPATSIIVNYGQGASFTFTPNAGYLISDVQVDGVSVGPVGRYDFTNVTTDHRIGVTFVAAYLLGIHMGPGVTGTPSSTATLPAGPVAYSYSLLPGYTGLSVVEDNLTTLPASGTIQLNAVHHLAITASVIQIPITYIVSAGGTILPSATGGILNVPYGQIPTFTFVPDPGYGLVQLWVDNVQVPLPSGTTYSLPAPVTTPHTLQAIFALLP
jgi:uncharacterized RmlC-like cupin family protein